MQAYKIQDNKAMYSLRAGALDSGPSDLMRLLTESYNYVEIVNVGLPFVSSLNLHDPHTRTRTHTHTRAGSLAECVLYFFIFCLIRLSMITKFPRV